MKRPQWVGNPLQNTGQSDPEDSLQETTASLLPCTLPYLHLKLRLSIWVSTLQTRNYTTEREPSVVQICHYNTEKFKCPWFSIKVWLVSISLVHVHLHLYKEMVKWSMVNFSKAFLYKLSLLCPYKLIKHVKCHLRTPDQSYRKRKLQQMSVDNYRRHFSFFVNRSVNQPQQNSLNMKHIIQVNYFISTSQTNLKSAKH